MIAVLIYVLWCAFVGYLIGTTITLWTGYRRHAASDDLPQEYEWYVMGRPVWVGSAWEL